MTVSVKYVKELDCYRGVGKQEDDDIPELTFTYYSPDNHLHKLRRDKPL